MAIDHYYNTHSLVYMYFDLLKTSFIAFQGLSLVPGGAGGATPWARAENFVKKPPLIVNVTNLELNGLNASMWVA